MKTTHPSLPEVSNEGPGFTDSRADEFSPDAGFCRFTWQNSAAEYGAMRSSRDSSGRGMISDAGRIAGAVLPVLAPIVVGGVAMVLMKAGLIRRIFSSEEQSLNRAQRLSRTILGNDKRAVAAALGPPEGSSGNAPGKSALRATTWYYRLDDRHRIALAIEFVNDVAAEASVLHARPRPRPHAGIERRALA